MQQPSRPGAGAPRVALLTCLLLAGSAAALAQTPQNPALATEPLPPSLVREADGRVIVRATRVSEPIRLDGRLDESVYSRIPPITDFIQQEPIEGAPVTERTEAWILFDDKNIYVVCRCWQANPELIVANDMRRDGPNINQHDSFGVQFDPFNDGRGGFFFYMSPVGGVRDAITMDARSNNDWNTVWNWKPGRFDGGWIAELAIPFKSLRYRPGREQIWGIQVRRLIRHKNERVHLTRLSAAWGGGAWNHLSHAATLVGLEAPPASRNLEIKPYVISSLTTDTLSEPPLRNEFDPDAGFDVKYGLTKGLTADLTYNTDFAQVEADEAQVNLTRFSLSFPEKREFFLEGANIFNFGTVTNTPRNESPGEGVAPLIFYSRRIGLDDNGTPLPVVAGGRVTGRAGPWSIGAMNIEVDNVEALGAAQTNFTVMRLQRNILRASSIGGIFTRRSVSDLAPGANTVWGLDANLAFYEHVNAGGYFARSRTDGLEGNDMNYRAQFIYNADRYGLFLDHQAAGEDFSPDVGFLRREDFRRSLIEARFSPRTTAHPFVRKWIYEGRADYITDTDNRLESREILGRFQLDLHNSDSFTVEFVRLHESLRDAFVIEDVPIPSGSYSFNRAAISYTAGQQYKLSGTTKAELGGFFGGERQTIEFSGRLELTPQLGIEPNISVNWVSLPEGRFTTTLLGSRTTFTMTPRMFVSALVQYSSADKALTTNLRFRWEYIPGSELFVVYSEGRSTFPPRGTELETRGLVFKVNRLFRF